MLLQNTQEGLVRTQRTEIPETGPVGPKIPPTISRGPQSLRRAA